MPRFQIIKPDRRVMLTLEADDRDEAIVEAGEAIGLRSHSVADTSDPLVTILEYPGVRYGDSRMKYLLRQTPYDDVAVACLAHHLRDQLKELEADDELDLGGPATSYALAARSVMSGKPMIISALADVAKYVLAWDSVSFLDALDVDNTGDIHAIPTRRGWERLNRLGLATHSVDFEDWDS